MNSCTNIIKRLVCLISGTFCIFHGLYALSAQEQLAQNAVNKYYVCLQEYAQNPGSFELSQKVKSLFDSDGNVVFNDLYEIENGLIAKNQESDIDGYMATIMSLWSRNDHTLKITGKIDQSSFIEEVDPDIKEAGMKVVWLTATKSISVSGQPIDDIRETFKVKNGKIQTISTPDRSTAIIDALRYYNKGDYENAYYGFIQQINNSTADDDTYFYLGLMFRKGKDICKKLYPSSDLRDKLCAFYWMKSRRGRQACYYFGIHNYYHLDFNRISNPFRCGLMTVYKGNGESYGYMNEKGKMIIPYKFKRAYSFSERTKLALVQSQESKWGLIRTDGSFALPAQYNELKMFADGIYAVRGMLNWGLTDVNGTIILPPKYAEIRPLQEELAAFKEGNKWGFIDMSGKVTIAAQYDNVLNFSSGLSAVVQDKRVGFINKNNNLVIPLIYEDATSFVPKMRIAAIRKNGKWGVIDKEGSVLLDILFDKIVLDDEKGLVTVYTGKEKTQIPQKNLKRSDSKLDKTKYISH